MSTGIFQCLMATYIYFDILTALMPGLAVTVRRLHDVGKSGWMYFIILIPIFGPIWLLFCYLQKVNKDQINGEKIRKKLLLMFKLMKKQK